MELSPTKLAYFDDMLMLESTAALLSHFQEEGGRSALIVDSTIFHPQGGGQPADTGFISSRSSGIKFVVEDVRLKDGLVFHYGAFEGSQNGCEAKFEEGQEVSLKVDAQRRNLNSRLHSAGHLLDICMRNVGLSYLEPGKGYHFFDGPFVEYKGIIPHDQLQSKSKELEVEAHALISKGGKVLVSVLPYEEASIWCGGALPPYIPKSSTPRVVKLGDNLGCPCGGTHVADIADIKSLKVDLSLNGGHRCSGSTVGLNYIRFLAASDMRFARAMRNVIKCFFNSSKSAWMFIRGRLITLQGLGRTFFSP